MINLEEISFKIIQKVGEAKYNATEAFKIAKESNDFSKAYSMIEDANKLINEAGSIHMDAIQAEARGEEIKFSILFMHAEDQFLSTQTFILSTKMMIEIMEKYEKK